MALETPQPQDGDPLAVIIEDHADTADLFARALDAAGFETTIMADGREAVTELATLRPALILLDLRLPFVPGERVLAQIRSDERLERTRIFLVTGEQQLASHLKEAVDLILLKPVPFEQLRELASRFRQSLKS
jgi:two-component system response regulator TctD